MVLSSHKRRSRLPLAFATLGIVLAAAAGGFLWYRPAADAANGAVRASPPAVPVTVEAAARRDLPIYLTGLGTVQAENTISILSQVDGTLQSVDFLEGQEVHKGDVLARIDPRPYQAVLDQAKAKKAQDEAQLVGAQKDLVRFQELAARKFGTAQNVDRQVAVVDQLKATIDADAAAIESAQTRLDYTVIKASIDGRIGVRRVDAGNVVHAADTTPIAILTQIRPASVVFTLPERNLAAVHQAMARGPVKVVAYDQDNVQAIGTGTLVLIDNQIDQTSSTIRLKATFPNQDEALWPGEFVRAHILIDTRKDAVTIASAAVQRGANGTYTWIVKPDGTAATQPIDVGPTQSHVTVINSGISAGDQVVVEGQYRLQAGARVDAKPANTTATTDGDGRAARGAAS
ncbi:efflux RND transporter periplasmic adaptor subunit [Mesorhizobium escarrei]|uniref:Multidrug efflux pump membrane fusion protein MdtA n=1 Tax=Mesorhizobium escarrei TaxID=666018 RepID=A0ABN8JE87_9HYPH|nr:efflux RND transporter periplasmic adaptor subunit [Mesorhizobium escarrei]CAH2396428.1 multidrug efflux pump membrane fusion protein MdtA [Mesorhizobium escarrei]